VLAAPFANAATCGDQLSSGKKAQAKLTLDPSSRTTISFGKSTGKRRLSLIFNASGCDLPDSMAAPRLVLVPVKDGDEIPDEALSVKSADTNGSGTYIVQVQVDASRFGAGSRRSLLILRADYLRPNSTRLA